MIVRKFDELINYIPLHIHLNSVHFKHAYGKRRRKWSIPNNLACMGAYAGMGTVYHWNVDWNGLKSKGVAETLLEPRGSFAMDEYVLNSIGIPFDSSEGKVLSQDIYNLAMWTFIEFMKDASREVAMPIAMEAMQAMYLLGMVYEMERLGMR